MAFNLTLTAAAYTTAAAKFTTALECLGAAWGVTAASVITSGIGAGGFSVRAWVRGGLGYTGIRAIAQQPNAFAIYRNSGGNLEATYGTGGTLVTLTPGSAVSLVDDVYKCIELCVGASGGYLFVDGVLKASSATTLAASGATYAGLFAVGSFSTGTYIWSGRIDDVSVWSGVNHTAGYTAPTTATDPNAANLLALWDFENNGLDSKASADTTAPTLTSPTGTSTGSTTASGTVSTDEANGTLYRLASTNATETAATVKAAALTQAVSATGSQAVTFSGLSASTTYYAHYVHRDAAGNDSTAVHSASFTTSAGADVTPPTLTSPTGTATGANTATGTVSTDEANGTLYYLASINATESAATVKAAGSQAVSATGVQAVSVSGLTAGTAYYLHYVHRDAAGNDSVVANSASFTTAAASATKAPNDAGILYSPYTWLVGSGSAKTINAGAYLRTLFSGASCTLNFDMTGLVAPYPRIVTRVDGATRQVATLAATVAVTMPSGQTNAQHLLEMVVDTTDAAQDRWVSQTSSVKLTGITLASSGDTLTLPQRRPKNLLCYGDSITEGINSLSSPIGGGSLADTSADVSWALELGRLLGAEVGVVGFGGTGFTTGGSDGTPTFANSWNYLWQGQSRDFSTPPDWCVWNEGTNGATIISAAALAVLNPQLAAMPGTKFILQRPFEDDLQTPGLSGACSGSNDPARCLFVTSAGWLDAGDFSDGLHPFGYALVAKVAPRLATSALGFTPALAMRTVTLTLTTDGATAAASLAGLKWAWFDSPQPQSFSAPTSKGAVEATDGSGVLSISVQSALASGGIGWLIVTNSDGTTSQSPAARAFSGPVAVA